MSRPTAPYYVGPVWRDEFERVECATLREAERVALAMAIEGRAVIVRDAARQLITTGKKLLTYGPILHG